MFFILFDNFHSFGDVIISGRKDLPIRDTHAYGNCAIKVLKCATPTPFYCH